MRVVFLMLLFCLLSMMSLTNASASDATRLATIIEGVRSYESKLFQEVTEFRIGVKDDVKTVTPAEKGTGLPCGRELARKNSLWFAQVRCLARPANDLREVQIAKDGMLFEWRISDPFCFVHDFDNGWNFFHEWGYFQRLGLNIYKPIIETNNQDYRKIADMMENRALSSVLARPMLPDCLEANQSEYLVHQDKEEVDDELCWVVEYPGVDKLWIDPAKGFLVRKRIYHFGPGEPVWCAIHNTNFREIKPGLWVPFTQIEDNYADISYQPQSLWGKVIQQVTYTVDYFEISNVDDSLFVPQVEPGRMVWDSSREVEYRISEGNTDPFAGPLARAIERRPFSVLRAIALVVGAISLLLVLWLKVRRGRQYGA